MTSHQPRKRFGQHFLKDTMVLHKLMREMQPLMQDTIIEIGPGQGALTDVLLQNVSHLDAVELDRDLVIYLQEKYTATQLTLHAADALFFDYATLSKAPKDLRIVGNLPYNISTPLLFHLFTFLPSIRDMHFMLQKEVVLRLTAKPGDPNYGRLSVMSQYFCDNDYLFSVPPGAFDPPPKVDSAIVRLIPKTEFPLTTPQFDFFSAIVKEAFNYRRKKIGNSVKKLISNEQLMACDINPNARPEEISGKAFVQLARILRPLDRARHEPEHSEGHQ